MRPPLERGVPADTRRVERWMTYFAGYWEPLTRAKIEEWIGQFQEEHRDLAARLLDSTVFYSRNSVTTAFRALIPVLQDRFGFGDAAAQGRWFFVPFSTSAGQSADSMIHAFRVANGMDSKAHDDKFCYRSDLVSKRLGPDDTVVLIDDFSGTGKQATDAWTQFFSEILAGGPRVVLLLACATAKALQKVRDETDMEPISNTELGEEANFFSPLNQYFDADEKAAVMNRCEEVRPRGAQGFGDSGLLVVFYHRTPNNSLPILHANARDWIPLFPRR